MQADIQFTNQELVQIWPEVRFLTDTPCNLQEVAVVVIVVIIVITIVVVVVVVVVVVIIIIIIIIIIITVTTNNYISFISEQLRTLKYIFKLS